DRYIDVDKIPEIAFKIDIDSIYVNKHISFSSLADVLRMEEQELQILNPSYKKNVVNGSIQSPKRLIIPKVDYHTYAYLFEVLNPESDTKVLYASTAKQAIVEQPVKKESYHIVKKGETLGAIADN